MTGAGATGHLTGQGGGEQRSGFTSPPPRSPPDLRATRAPALRPTGAEGTSPLPKKGPRHQGGDAAGPVRRAPRRPPTPAHTGVAADGQARTSAPEQRTDRARGRHATTNRNSMGAAPPMIRASPVTPAMLPTRGGRGEGSGLSEPTGERFRGRPSPPPRQAGCIRCTGRPRDPDQTRTPGGECAGDERGAGYGTAGRPPEGQQGGRGATPPPRHPPYRPASRGGAGPHPPEAERMSPLPPTGPRRPRGGPEQGPPPCPSRLLPQELRRTSEPAPTRQGATQTAPGDGKRARTGAVWGPRPP